MKWEIEDLCKKSYWSGLEFRHIAITDNEEIAEQYSGYKSTFKVTPLESEEIKSTQGE